MSLLEILFWAAAGLLVYAHVGYPLVLAVLSRLGPDRSWEFSAAQLPTVTLLVAAHNEQEVIGGWVERALALDYPADRLGIVVVCDGCSDETAERARAAGAHRVLELERGGKVAALNVAANDARGEVLAFSDANSIWERDALRLLVERLAKPGVGYVCGQVSFTGAERAENQEGLYWRYEMAVRRMESDLGGITAGNGAINAVRREAYVFLEPTRGQDISLPFELAKQGWRSVYEPRARATEPMAPTIEGEFERKRRMMAGAWNTVLRTGLLSPRGYRPVYAFQIYSHRLLRYATPFLHLVAMFTNALLLDEGIVYVIAMIAQISLVVAALLSNALPLRPLRIARYYVAVTMASAVGLGDLLRHGVPRTWESVEGTRMSPAADVVSAGLPRLVDFAIASVALVLLSPILAVAALAIKLDSRGPVIYRSRRAGRGGEPFQLMKLRTMRPDSDPVGVGTPVFEGDPRVTRVGARLRRLSLDELPNLVNVLRGELAIVGPRPTLEAQVAQYTEHQRRRLAVRPGITGWAQVNGRAGVPWDERIELDVWYVENRSARLDLRILARTARLLVTGHGLYG